MKIETLARKDVKNLITRPLHANKGDAGSVLIVIGSDTYVGAAVMAGIAAFRAGTDVVGIVAPERAAITINGMSTDLITYKFAGKNLSHAHLSNIKSLIDKYTTLLIGPGADISEGLAEELISYARDKQKSIVLDANVAIQPIDELENCSLLVNKSEYKRFLKKNNFNATVEDVHNSDEKAAKKSKEQLEEERLVIEHEKLVNGLGTNSLIAKNQTDYIFSNERILSSSGGSLRATVAGTGDVVAGLAAGFRAQNANPEQALMLASTIAKRVAEILEGKKYFSFLASEYLRQIPEVLKELKVFRVVKHI